MKIKLMLILLLLTGCTTVQEPNILANMDLTAINLDAKITEIESCNEWFLLFFPGRQEGTTLMSAWKQNKLSKLYWYDRTHTLFFPLVNRDCIRLYGKGK